MGNYLNTSFRMFESSEFSDKREFMSYLGKYEVYDDVGLDISFIRRTFDGFTKDGWFDKINDRFEEIKRIFNKVNIEYIQERFLEFWDDYPLVITYELFYILYGDISSYNRENYRYKYNGMFIATKDPWMLGSMLRNILNCYESHLNTDRIESDEDLDKLLEMYVPSVVIGIRRDKFEPIDGVTTTNEFHKEISMFVEDEILSILDYEEVIIDSYLNDDLLTSYEMKIILN